MKKQIRKGFRQTKYIFYQETLVDFKDHFWSFLGAFFGIGIIAFLQSQQISEIENVFLIGSFGASSVLIYGAVNSPLAQPRNLIGGHVLSALVGVTVFKFLPEILWLNASIAVASSIVVMQITKTMHPPGGATALIAVLPAQKIQDLGYWYALSPVLSGAVILLIVALIFNNIPKGRKYPHHVRQSKYVHMRRMLKKKN
ncbi:HPP family protein [Epilithonimonas sp. JDS]|uniref:HPP family protein n=1 Tax=Epilithonimonas sp. JDS TaxID=2902797 RepID=UPI001E59CD36|nr:HPP family protein [Epilithonimonas sp. JDS]MCD9856512.1 HPP family protein [Epilithonimonas sp. JDS]WDF47670.1 HPP family protein [Chryseobacterium sp. KACC 21268]